MLKRVKKVLERLKKDERAAAQIFFEMVGTIFAISVIYWLAILPCFEWIKAFALWIGYSLECQAIIDNVNTGAAIIVAIPYVGIILTIVWSFREAATREAYEKMFKL
ncbi:hypothetical protein DRP07_00705 [Archaeoglobales archaeon]|nr:MAG: hypothetical protein DRP07_00705 [Archaeoglobales archaeon]